MLLKLECVHALFGVCVVQLRISLRVLSGNYLFVRFLSDTNSDMARLFEHIEAFSAFPIQYAHLTQSDKLLKLCWQKYFERVFFFVLVLFVAADICCCPNKIHFFVQSKLLCKRRHSRNPPGLADADFSAFLFHYSHELFNFGRQSYKASNSMRGAVLVGFSSQEEMEARVRDNNLGDAMLIYARSANELPYNPEHQVYVVFGIANADKTRMEINRDETTLYFCCEGCEKIWTPERQVQAQLSNQGDASQTT
jgi:hypothetical protein